MNEAEIVNHRICQKLVDREVIYCVSTLIWEIVQKRDGFSEWEDELNDLAYSMPSVEDLLDAADHIAIEDSSGYVYALAENLKGDYDKIYHPDDDKLEELRDEFLDDEGQLLSSPEDPRSVSDDLGLDIYDYTSEVLEHWIVSEYLGRKLQECGETVVEIMGLTVWGRTCSGQAIAMDGVIKIIAKDMGILSGQENHKYWAD